MDYGTGYLLDKADPVRAFRSEEIMSAPPPVAWSEKPPATWNRYGPIRNQAKSNACVSFSVALMLGAENKLEEGKFVKLAPRPIYARKFVPPDGGMFYADALALGTTLGLPPEDLMPSEGKDEPEMRVLADEKESDRLTAKVYRGGQFVYIDHNIEAIASIIAQGKAVALGTRFNQGGFSQTPVKLSEGGTYGHAVVGVDYTLYQGKKCIVFQNSWSESWGLNGLNLITEDDIKGGGFVLAAYFTNFSNKPDTGTKPKLRIYSASLSQGSASKEDIVKLQTMLQYLGFFPSGTECTGFYGGITRQAVKDYQKENNLIVSGVADWNTIGHLNNAFV